MTPKALWDKSLPFRVVLITLLASVGILAGAGFFLLGQSSEGIIEGKTQASLAEAVSVLQSMQTELAKSDSRTVSPNEQVNRLARDAATRGQVGNQYYVLAWTPVAVVGSLNVAPSCVPNSIRNAAASQEYGMWSVPTTIVFRDGRQPEPGLVIAGALTAAGHPRYTVFFIFPTSVQEQTLTVVRQATLVAGVLLLIAMAAVVNLVARVVLRPVRAAAVAAERLASGHLEDRLEVSGTSDLGSLATSMNFMAAELERQITELEDLSAVQQRFVSDVSHELRTPMTTIRMATDVISKHRNELQPPAMRSSELLSKEVDRFEALLAELLEMSRFDAGAAILNTDEVDLSKLVTEEVGNVLILAQELGVKVKLDTEGIEIAEIDSRRVRRIMRNLLTNAVEHGEGKPVEVTVRGNEHSVAVTVRDYGVGLLEEQLPHVFDRFWRGDPSRTRRVGGIGLGLAISLEDARLHGGHLEVWGAPENGAQFRLTLPRQAGADTGKSPLPLSPKLLDGGEDYEI